MSGSKDMMMQRLLAKVKDTRGDKPIRANSKLGALFQKNGVRNTSELQRILRLPKRDWHDILRDDYKSHLSAHLRREGSAAMLFDAQTAALTEFTDYGGFLGNIGLGEGKCVVGSTTIYDAERGRVQVKDEQFSRVVASDTQGKLHIARANIFSSGVKECVQIRLRDGSRIALSTDHPVRTHLGWVPAAQVTPAHLVAVARKYPAPTKEFEVDRRQILEVASEKQPVPAGWWCLSTRDVQLYLQQIFGQHGLFEDEGILLYGDADLLRDVRFFCSRLGILTQIRSGSAPVTKTRDQIRTKPRPNDLLFIEIRHESVEDFLRLGFANIDPDEVQERLARSAKKATDLVPITRTEVTEMGKEDCWPRGAPTQVREAYGLQGVFISRRTFAAICDRMEYHGKQEWLIHNDYVWERVKEVEPFGDHEVFDLSVPDYHNFFGNGVLLHNTLITALAPTLVGAERPVLLAPGSLREKTTNDFVRYRKDWLVHPRIEFVSYEQLSRNPELLIGINPDVLMADEVHCLKNLGAGCTKRVKRFMSLRPDTKFLGLSGTVSTRSLRQFWHLMMWALGPENMPLPRNYDELDEWAKAVDEKITGHERLEPGMLLEKVADGGLGGKDIEVPEGTDPDDKGLVQARMAIRQRLETTAGYMMTTSISCGASISLELVKPPKSMILDGAIQALRDQMKDLNGDELIRPADVWAKARMISCGFFYKWYPPPPDPWREARKNWNRFARYALGTYSRRIDTPMHLAQEIIRGTVTEPFDIAYDPNAPVLDNKPHVPVWRTPMELLTAWRLQQPTYKYQLVPTWLDETRVEWIADKYLRDVPGDPYIVWVEHVAVGEKLAELTGRPFHHTKSLDAHGVHIEKASGPIIASVEANYKGVNLQQYHRNFIVSCLPSGMMWEQLFGRTHRRGQLEDNVSYEVMIACTEHTEGLAQVMRDAEFAKQTQNQPQRLLLADKLNS